ncbi:TenA family protein [Cognatishimia maritima]|uniref:Aminopyrimidine aminohydrolase n=1 Tax=Cognatishimia maritima TaxID=870908 RepID=A0A1M5MWS0_9RHOB|nr:TenA family protein [Cognatishimia maritima]SHG81776.1 thiaminase (transcriptional activator TenA) [Cognatishimia maritima]
MRPTDMLKMKAAEDWILATRHPFTAALADGTLKSDLMRGYLQQDYLFIDQFVRLLATTIAHAPTLADSVPAAQFLGVITGPENTYFLRSFEALDIQPEADPAPETVNFQNLMEEARLSGRYEIMLAVLVVAEWVYLEWATPFADRIDDLPFWFGEWIALHCGEGFEGVVDYLRGQLDTVWDGLEPHEQAMVEEYFCEAVKRERAFFEGAWAGFPVAS